VQNFSQSKKKFGYVYVLTPKGLSEKMILTGWHAINLGTGQGYSVLGLVQTYEKVSGKSIPCKIGDRRPGDIACSFAMVSLANKKLGWCKKKCLDDMCKSSWKWQQLGSNK